VETSNNDVAKSVLGPTHSLRRAFCNTNRPIMLIRLNLFVRMSCQPCLFACHASLSDTLLNEDIFYVTHLRVVELMCLLPEVVKRNVGAIMFLTSSALTCRCTGKLITTALFSRGGSRLRVHAF
jgi:hypothetical protein